MPEVLAAEPGLVDVVVDVAVVHDEAVLVVVGCVEDPGPADERRPGRGRDFPQLLVVQLLLEVVKKKGKCFLVFYRFRNVMKCGFPCLGTAQNCTKIC